jgi:hypothetical protein
MSSPLIDIATIEQGMKNAGFVNSSTHTQLFQEMYGYSGISFTLELRLNTLAVSSISRYTYVPSTTDELLC